MVLDTGAKLLICHRRLFETDQPRFFVGAVEAWELGVVKVRGFSFTRDASHGYQRKQDERTKLVALASGTVIAYELPKELAIADLRIEQPDGNVVVLTDGGGFRMDIAERQRRAAA